MKIPLNLTERQRQLYTGDCPPEHPCSPQDVAEYRAYFDGTQKKGCVHFGEYTGEKEQCLSCGGNVRIKIYACAIHQKCTMEKELEGIACCSTCKDFKESESAAGQSPDSQDRPASSPEP